MWGRNVEQEFAELENMENVRIEAKSYVSVRKRAAQKSAV